MNYGVFQEYYTRNRPLRGSNSISGIIGTTSNGVMYLSMPFLFALFSRRWAYRRQTAALVGAALNCVSFLLSSFSTSAWHLVITLGIMAALGCALIYSPTTLSLGEWFNGHNRAVAYGVSLSCKNIIGSACPFLRGLLDRYGFRTTMHILTVITASSALLCVSLVPNHPSAVANVTESATTPRQARRIPWHFLRHRTFHVYSVAIVLQSSGYGIPQTYLPSYASDIAHLSRASATLLLTIFNVPGIVASAFFGYLSDNTFFPLRASTTTAVSAASSALAAFLLWGSSTSAADSSMALLICFALFFGFFAGGYSATWGGIVNEMELEAAARNEAIDTGDGVWDAERGERRRIRGGGVGGASGGMVGAAGYGTSYGPLIVFTGLSTIFGGWGIVWRWWSDLRSLSMR